MIVILIMIARGIVVNIGRISEISLYVKGGGFILVLDSRICKLIIQAKTSL